MGTFISYQAAFAVAFCYIIVVIAQHVKSPLRDIPGPFSARFSKLWYLYKIFAGRFHHDNIELHEKHGPIVRVAPNTYSISEPTKTVYGIASNFAKSSWYDSWKHPDADRITLFSDRNMKRHNESRRRVQGLYSMSTLVAYEYLIDECNGLLYEKLRGFAKSKAVIDLSHWFQCYAFDVTGHITFSQRFGFLDEGKDVNGMMNSINRSTTYSTCAGIYTSLHPYLYPILERIPSSSAAGIAEIISVILNMIDKHKQKRAASPKLKHSNGSASPADFMDKIMNAKDADPSKTTDAHLFIIGWSNITAGSDTTGVSLSAIMYYLIRNPHAMQRLRQEVEDVDNTNFSFSHAESQNMPYLQASIKEALRVHAAVGLPLWRVVPKGGATICGRFFPEDSVVGTNSWVAHYNKEVYGSDADLFRPERWLEASGERLRLMESFWMPFGLGSRTCIGRHISMLEISKLLPVLVRSFEFELKSKADSWITHNHWFVKPQNFKVTVKLRNSA